MKAWNVIKMKKKIAVYKILIVTNSSREFASIQSNQ